MHLLARRRASDYANTQRLVIRVQARWRSHLAKKRVREKMRRFRALRESSAAKIQCAWRQRQHFKRCVRLLQSIVRQRSIRQWYIVLRNSAIIVQTWARGRQCRVQALVDRRARIMALRTAICRGWNATAVPLLKRSRFWLSLDMDHPSYLDLGIHLDEMQWIEERKRRFGVVGGGSATGVVAWSATASIESETKQQEHRRGEGKAPELRQQRGGQFRRDTSTANSLMAHVDSLELAREALVKQRKDLYWRLKGLKGHRGLSKEQLESHFDMFGISKRKRRKRKLCNMVWCVDEEPWRKSSAVKVGQGTMMSDQNARNRGSALIVISCLEPTDIDWAARWRQHRVEENILLSLRATLEALHRDRLFARGKTTRTVLM